MTRSEFRQIVEQLAGDRLTTREVKLIVEAASAYATGDTWELQRARRRILAREAAAAERRGYGRPRARSRESPVTLPDLGGAL
jgi:hypothetical protein